MEMREEIERLIGLISIIPTLIIILIHSIAFSTGRMNATDHFHRWAETISSLVVPWWVTLLLGGTVWAFILIILLLLFGRKILSYN